MMGEQKKELRRELKQRLAEIPAEARASSAASAAASVLTLPEYNSAKTVMLFLSMSRELFPGLPVVGYERGPGLAHAQQTGFRLLDALRVWIQQK